MNDPPSPDEARDEAQLKALAMARAVGDIAALREAMGLLIGPYWEYARGIAFSRLASSQNREQDAEEVAAAVSSRLVKALNDKTDFGKPFWKVAYDNLEWELGDYFRARAKNKSSPHDPAKLPTLDHRNTEQASPVTETQVRDFRSYLDILGELDRQIITERILFDLSPEQIAANHNMTVGNVYTRLSRALRQLRESPALDDVRKRREDTA